MALGPFLAHADDLAPGDRGVLDTSWSSFTVESVRSEADPGFDEGWGRLWEEFGDRGEMERREVIADRLAWDPTRLVGGYAFLYEMLVVREAGEVVAIRDHTAIARPALLAGGAGAAVVVHLSHVLVVPAMRGKGLASWMRAMPVDTARRCFARATGSGPAGTPDITLVAEMEPDDGATPAVVRRLRSYAKAGFRVADPSRIRYLQPDFRACAEIDRTSVQSVPLCLVMRRVGREDEARVSGIELRRLVEGLQAMFGEHVRRDHMDDVRRAAAQMPADDETIALLVPGAAPLPGQGAEANR